MAQEYAVTYPASPPATSPACASAPIGLSFSLPLPPSPPPRAPPASCSSQRDCPGYEECLSSNTCGCPPEYALTGQPECTEWTAETAWAVGVISFLVCMYVVLSAFSTLHFFRIRSARSGYLKSASGLMCASLYMFLVSRTHDLTFLLSHGAYPGNKLVWILVRRAFVILGGVFFVTGMLVVTLKWHTLAATSARLRETSSCSFQFTVAYMTGFIAVSCVLGGLALAVDELYYYIWLFSTFSTAALLVALTLIGARRMRALLFRATERAKGFGSSDESARMAARAADVVRASHRMAAGLSIFVLAALLWIIASWLEARRSLLWLTNLFTFGGLAIAQLAIVLHVALQSRLTLEAERYQVVQSARSAGTDILKVFESTRGGASSLASGRDDCGFPATAPTAPIAPTALSASPPTPPMDPPSPSLPAPQPTLGIVEVEAR